MNWIVEGKQDIRISITTDKSGYLIIIGLIVTFQIKIYIHHHYSCKVCKCAEMLM